MAVIPNRLLNAPQAELDLLQEDEMAYSVFVQEEREKVSSSFLYFLENYASHIPADGGSSQPLQMWAYQPKMAEALVGGNDVVCLKSRRIGFTLIVCHLLVWTAGLSKKTPGATCIAISKNQRDADQLLETCRKIIDSLPDYLRPAVGAEAKDEQGRVGRETTRHFSFPERSGASIRSLPASSSAARSYTATLLFLDELAFHPNSEEVWISSKPTTEGGGQVIVGSTGNGTSGDGKQFYHLWQQGESDPDVISPLFIPWYEREDRSQEWYDQVEKTMPSQDAMTQEYPADPEDAFRRNADTLAFSSSNLSAAERLGKHYDELLAGGAMPEPHGGVQIGIDWGLNSAVCVVYPLAGFGFYIADEYASNQDDAETFSTKAIDLGSKYSKGQGLERAFYDAAGAQQMKSFARVAPAEVRITGIPFGKFKQRSVEFIRLLLKRTAAEEEIGYLAISRRCTETIRQLRDIQQGEDGKLQKGSDHSCDALIAGLAQAAVQWDREFKNR